MAGILLRPSSVVDWTLNDYPYSFAARRASERFTNPNFALRTEFEVCHCPWGARWDHMKAIQALLVLGAMICGLFVADSRVHADEIAVAPGHHGYDYGADTVVLYDSSGSVKTVFPASGHPYGPQSTMMSFSIAYDPTNGDIYSLVTTSPMPNTGVYHWSSNTHLATKLLSMSLGPGASIAVSPFGEIAVSPWDAYHGKTPIYRYDLLGNLLGTIDHPALRGVSSAQSLDYDSITGDLYYLLAAGDPADSDQNGIYRWTQTSGPQMLASLPILAVQSGGEIAVSAFNELAVTLTDDPANSLARQVYRYDLLGNLKGSFDITTGTPGAVQALAYDNSTPGVIYFAMTTSGAWPALSGGVFRWTEGAGISTFANLPVTQFADVSVFFVAVPEPSTLAMLSGLGGLGLVGCLWRGRRS